MYGDPATTVSPAPSPEGQGAVTLILVAFVLQFLITVVFALAFFAASGNFAIGAGAITVGIGGLFLLAAWFGAYVPAKAGRYADAAPWTLVLGILGVPLGLLVVGILYIVAYVKLGRAAHQVAMGGRPAGSLYYNPALAPNPAPARLPMPAYPPRPFDGAPPVATPIMASAIAPPTCPTCGQPGTWVPQYQRYYCYRCQQYLW